MTLIRIRCFIEIHGVCILLNIIGNILSHNIYILKLIIFFYAVNHDSIAILLNYLPASSCGHSFLRHHICEIFMGTGIFLVSKSLAPGSLNLIDVHYLDVPAAIIQSNHAVSALNLVCVDIHEILFMFVQNLPAILQPDERCRVLATDGQVLFYQPSHLLRLYQDNPKYLNRLYLHTIFHCVFRHLWLKGRREPQLWSLACDIAVENVIDSLNRTSVKRPLTYVRQNAYQQITAEETVVAAAPVYRWLTRQTPGVLRQLEREFVTDDHRLWPKDAPDQPQQMPTPLPQKTWQKIGERMQTELDLRDKEAGDGADALKQQVKAANRSRRSYRDFLRRFCVLREEVKLDPDEFDLNFYTYGLSVYGNLPLIEPLESRESKKIEELALVIDTSYSTSGELVRAFLAETYTLLKGQENFFHRMNLHLIQADNAIRQDILIHNEDELIHAMNHFELRGGGGTDFRPAFEYVNQLCAEKKFSNLRGLLYFTDGMGTYPAKRPAYDTAFLFLGERFDDANVPPWAMKVVLDEEEFTGAAARPQSTLADALAEEDDLYRDLNNS